MRKEQIDESCLAQSLQKSQSLTDSRRTSRRSCRNWKQLQRKRYKIIRRTKRNTNSDTIRSSLPSLSLANENATLPRAPQTTALTPPPISVAIKAVICSPFSGLDQSRFQLCQIQQYLENIGEHLFQRQSQFPLNKIQYSARFGPGQRLHLVELISLQCSRLKLKLQTQFLALDIFHRICTSASFERYHSALKAASALYVAAKYEELCAPQACHFSTLDPNQIIIPQNIVKLQGVILLHLNFNLSYANPLKFAQLLALRFQLNTQSRQTLMRLCRRAVCSEQLWMGRSSLLAMACLCVLFGRVREWEEIGQLRSELDWRIATLHQILGQ